MSSDNNPKIVVSSKIIFNHFLACPHLCISQVCLSSVISPTRRFKRSARWIHSSVAAPIQPITINRAQTQLRQLLLLLHLPARRTQEQTETSTTARSLVQPQVNGPWTEERLYTALPVSLEGLAHPITHTDRSSIRST